MKGALPMPFSYRSSDDAAHQVYTIDELKRYDPSFLLGVRNGVKSMQKRLPPDAYFIAIMSKRTNTYVPTSNMQRAKILVKHAWVLANLLDAQAATTSSSSDVVAESHALSVASAMQGITIVEPEANSEQDDVIVIEQSTEQGSEATTNNMAPSLLKLEDSEKFRNAEGQVIDIETRGVRSPRGIFFRVTDVSRGFGIKSLKNSLLHPNPSYQRTRDFITFRVPVDNVNLGTNMTRTSLFLTYIGLLRVLFVSRNNNTEVFYEWATERLFAAQMGDRSQRAHSAAQLLGVSYQSIIDVYDTCSIPVSCVYLFLLGTVRNLRLSMNIPPEYDDSSLVAKYGKTEDLKRRTGEHQRDYGAIQNSQLVLVAQAWVDPLFIHKAENRLREHFEHAGYKLKVNGSEILHDESERSASRNEIVVIPADQLKHVKSQFVDIQTIHCGRMKDAVIKINRLEMENARLEEKHALTCEIQLKEIALQQKETEMQKKETEAMAERLEFAKQSHLLHTTIWEQQIEMLKQMSHHPPTLAQD